MKNIAIFGGARAGKTTLAKMIYKEFPNYHIISGDDIRYAFQKVLPDNEINSKGGKGMIDDFPNFLATYFYKAAKRNEGEISYIVETCDIYPTKAKELFNDENTILLFLGTPLQSEAEHFQEIRKYENEKDWTYDRDDAHIIEHCNYWIPAVRKIQEECQNLNLWFVDTSINREQVLEDTLKKIKDLIIADKEK